MKHSLKSLAGFLLVFCFTALACTIPGTGSSDNGNAEATAVFTDDSATFGIPTYTFDLEPGSTVPGSQLTYVGKSGDLYDVTINGGVAQKRGGDSFIWDGIVAPGVHANYNLRLLEVFGTLRAGGIVEVTVLNPVPTALSLMPEWPNAIRYNNILLTHSVAVGETIPGTTMVYDGVSTQGGVSSARLTGLTGHPLFATGDSITWIGNLRENAAIRYTFRVATFSENSLQLAGTAELLVNP
ncbi:MAG: hypothetical protein KC433_10280 [Anaerolineales bacterium]|nr:hypothetical protein [Anaerolineales bacterium]MCB8940006.1 hypothetical protein [Ardenticatenaceae bacterium]